MLTVRGIFRDGSAHPVEAIANHEGRPVIITFLERETSESDAATTANGDGWDALAQLIEGSAVETGITDLAHQHDHYLYGTPRRDE